MHFGGFMQAFPRAARRVSGGTSMMDLMIRGPALTHRATGENFMTASWVIQRKNPTR